MCLQQVKKYVTGPWFSWNLVNIFLTYMASFLCWKSYLDNDRNMLKIEIQIRLNTKYTFENWGTMALKWMPADYRITNKAI